MRRRSWKFLIADDSALLRERFARMLTEINGVEWIGEAADWVEVREWIPVLQPDVLILDLRLPSGRGLEMLHWIRRNGWGAVVIVLTNLPYPQYRERCLAAGADYFFDKAEEFECVKHTIVNLIGKQSLATVSSSKSAVV